MAKSRKSARCSLADLLDERLRRHSFLLGLEHDRRAVPVVRAHVRAAVAAPALEPHPDVGLDVFHQMPEVDRAVRVRQCARHQESASRDGHGIDSVASRGTGWPRTLAPRKGGVMMHRVLASKRVRARHRPATFVGVSGGGGGGIRTHGASRLAGFQDQCFRPLSHPNRIAAPAPASIPQGPDGPKFGCNPHASARAWNRTAFSH